MFLLRGGVAEWSMAADCKSARVSVHRFKSCLLHHPTPSASSDAAIESDIGAGVPSVDGLV